MECDEGPTARERAVTGDDHPQPGAVQRRALAGLAGLAGLAAGAVGGLAGVPGAAAAAAPADIHRPAAVPDRVILTWRGDPARAQAVTWRTDANVKSGQGQIVVADATPTFKARAATVNGQTTTLQTNLGYVSNYHTVHFENLTPKTKYL